MAVGCELRFGLVTLAQPWVPRALVRSQCHQGELAPSPSGPCPMSGQWPLWSPKPVFPHSCLMSGSLCPLPPGPHLESHLVRQLLAGREGALLTQTSCSLSPETGLEGLLEGLRTSCSPSGPVVRLFCPDGALPGLQVGLSPLSSSPPSLLCPVLQPLPVWPSCSHPGLRVEAPPLAGEGTHLCSPDTNWRSTPSLAAAEAGVQSGPITLSLVSSCSLTGLIPAQPLRPPLPTLVLIEHCLPSSCCHRWWRPSVTPPSLRRQAPPPPCSEGSGVGACHPRSTNQASVCLGPEPMSFPKP